MFLTATIAAYHLLHQENLILNRDSDGLSENITLKLKVTQNFEVVSTDSGFDCARLDKMRSSGSFVGNYSCQGHTLPAGSSDGISVRGHGSISGLPCMPLILLMYLSWFI